MNHKSNVNTTKIDTQADNAKIALLPINEIHQHAVEVQHCAADASTLLGLACDLLVNLPSSSAEDHHAYTNIDCLIRSARRALGQIDEAGAAVSLLLEDAGTAAEGGAA